MKPAGKKGAPVQVRLTLDPDAADLLLRLAGSPRKQGEYVSSLIRAAAMSSQDSDPAAPVRQLALQLASQLTLLTNQLLEIAGQPGRPLPSRLLEREGEEEQESGERQVPAG